MKKALLFLFLLTAFNRTTLELKFSDVRGKNGAYLAFNRTTLELKFILIGVPASSRVLLIEPLWN